MYRSGGITSDGLSTVSDPTEQAPETQTEGSAQKCVRAQQEPSQIIKCCKSGKKHFMKKYPVRDKPVFRIQLPVWARRKVLRQVAAITYKEAIDPQYA